MPRTDLRQLALERPQDNAAYAEALSAFADVHETYALDFVHTGGGEFVSPLCASPRSGPDIAGVRATYNLQDERDRLRIGFAQMRHVIRW